MSTVAIEHPQDKRTGAIVTIVLHALVLILFMLFGLTQPNPLPEDEGIELSFEEAGGLTGGAEIPDPGTPPPSAATTTAPVTPEDVATEEESPVELPKPVTPAPKPNPKPAEVQPPKPNPNALFNPSSNPSENQTGPPGGGPTGDRPGDGGAGSFHGTGFEGKLGGRGLSVGPRFTDKPQEEGRVALNIFVDRQGNVVRVTQNLDKSTTTSQVLFNMAKKAAMQCKFSVKADAAAEQKGEMIFTFVLE
jgi:hypothetical protein